MVSTSGWALKPVGGAPTKFAVIFAMSFTLVWAIGYDALLVVLSSGIELIRAAPVFAVRFLLVMSVGLDDTKIPMTRVAVVSGSDTDVATRLIL